MAMPEGIKAIDTWINLNPPKGWEGAPTRGHLRDSESLDTEGGSHLRYLFPGVSDRMGKGATPDEIVELMDRSGIEKALLRVPSGNPGPALKAIEQHPDKFIGAVSVNPHNGMNEVRLLEKLVKEHGVKAAKVSSHTIQMPYNDKIYYPIYAKCIELDIPITANVGIPGPRVPGLGQHPMPLDEVCWFFPELRVVMTHGGEPWQALCVKLMLKWPNLYYMTSAFAPSHYPQEIIYYMNTRGTDKVMFASAYPYLGMDRCMKEAKDLPLRDHVWAKFLRENAIKVFKL